MQHTGWPWYAAARGHRALGRRGRPIPMAGRLALPWLCPALRCPSDFGLAHLAFSAVVAAAPSRPHGWHTLAAARSRAQLGGTPRHSRHRTRHARLHLNLPQPAWCLAAARSRVVAALCCCPGVRESCRRVSRAGSVRPVVSAR